MKVTEIPMIAWKLLPPPKDKCQTCAAAHKEDEPHDATSLFYLTKFKIENNREATWEDAMSHCDEPSKKLWRVILKASHGIDSTSTNVFGVKHE